MVVTASPASSAASRRRKNDDWEMVEPPDHTPGHGGRSRCDQSGRG
jgi:hypothetical protein